MRSVALGLLLALASAVCGGEPREPSGTLAPQELICRHGNVAVRSPDPSDARAACKGAGDAIEFLSAQVFDTASPVKIEITPTLPESAGPSAVGCYLESEERVVILTSAAFKKRETWMGIPIDTQMYRSLATHEVAHAIAACNFKIRSPPVQAKEYIAYVTMLATMEPAWRERILAGFPGEGFADEWQMSTMIYLIDTHRFGVQAYRHYLKPGNGRDFLQAIVQGKAITE